MPDFRKFPVRKDGVRTAVFPDGYQGKKGLFELSSEYTAFPSEDEVLV